MLHAQRVLRTGVFNHDLSEGELELTLSFREGLKLIDVQWLVRLEVNTDLVRVRVRARLNLEANDASMIFVTAKLCLNMHDEVIVKDVSLSFRGVWLVASNRDPC